MGHFNNMVPGTQVMTYDKQKMKNHKDYEKGWRKLHLIHER